MTDYLIEIANRAMVMGNRIGVKRNAIQYMMDLDAVNETIPLDFERLALADDFNFAHDVFGIMNHLNRTTDKLENFFLPRFMKRG